jgi:hypothetical protein
MTFDDPIEASILRGQLEAEGIRCFVQDELTMQALLFASSAIGGIKLRVRERDARRALYILRRDGYTRPGDARPTPLEMKLYRLFSRLPFLRRIYK